MDRLTLQGESKGRFYLRSRSILKNYILDMKIDLTLTKLTQHV